MRSIKDINKDIQAAKNGEYFKKSQKFVSIVACLAISGLVVKWVEPTISAVAGEICGDLSACIVIGLGKICSGYIESGIKSYFFEPLTNKLVLPMLEAEKRQAEEESAFSLFYKVRNWAGA